MICKQGVKKAVSAVLPPEAAVTHFYGNRGSNVFQDFKRAIVFGMPGMTPETVLRYAAAFYHQDNLSTDTEEQIRVYAGKQVGVKVLVYKEPLIQAIAETAREDEVLQSIHRIRPGLDPGKDIVVITNLVLPELPVTDLVSVDDLLGRKQQERTDKKLETLTRLAMKQWKSLGFVSPARTLWPIVGNGPPDKEARNMLTEATGVVPGAASLRISRTTLHDYKQRVRVRCGLEAFTATCATPRGRSRVEIWGKDAGCVEKAGRFFMAHSIWREEQLCFEALKEPSQRENGSEN